MPRRFTVRAADMHTRPDFETAMTMRSFRGLHPRGVGGGSAGGGARTASAGITVELEPGATAASEARAALAALDGRIDRDALDDVRLLVSELVTNSVRHSGVGPGDRVRLTVASRGDKVRVEVVDPGSGFEPRPRTADQEKGSGWGLHLVERLAARWGVESGRRTRVWFEIETA